MKSAVICLALVLLAARSTAGKSDWKRPEFCGNSDCPPFEVVNTTDDYEIRKYEAGMWVMTDVSESKYELAYTKAAAKLLRYYSGANDAKERLERTTPLLGMLKLSKDSQETERNYTFSMWLPGSYQKEDEEDIPEPNDEALEIMDFPETTGYVRVFGGFATEATILQEATALHEALTKDGEEYEEDIVFVAVYDPAVKLLNRHNEVHVLKKGEAPSFRATRRSAQVARS